jgi:hypothetical protein
MVVTYQKIGNDCFRGKDPCRSTAAPIPTPTRAGDLPLTVKEGCEEVEGLEWGRRESKERHGQLTDFPRKQF